MPPRVQRRAVRRATARGSRPPRARARVQRSGNRRVLKNEVKADEEKPVEVEEKPKPESWLDKLPPVTKPDEELHQRLTKERHEKRLIKVRQYCSLEAKGMLEFSLRSIDVARNFKYESDEIFGRKMRQLHSDFREGLLTPDPDDIGDTIEPATITTKLEPKFSLEVQNYLRFTSDSMWKDLSTFFNCQLNEDFVHDPDPKLNEFLDYLQEKMKLFQQPYHPFDKIQFPFNICIIGPIGTGRTTVCQLLQKIFDVNIIEVVPQPPSDNLIRKKKNITSSSDQIPETEPPPEYPLFEAFTIKMTDDKTTINSIAQYICENAHRGTIVVGYPNTKSQLLMLEKAINQQHNLLLSNSKNSINESGSTTTPRSPHSPSQTQSPLNSNTKSKTPVLNIHGLIFTLNTTNQSREKLIDPETGNVYQEDFIMPSFLDFYDVVPINFLTKEDEILNRLTHITVPEFPPVTSKAISSMNVFESGCRKNYVTCVIPHCDSIDMMINQLDLFIDSLFKKNDKEIIEKPLEHLSCPRELTKPGLCYNAILSWRKCLEFFGPTIADQSNLVDIIGNRLDQMSEAAFDRFALFTFTSDKRFDLCKEFQEKESSVYEDQNAVSSSDKNIKNSDSRFSHFSQSALTIPQKNLLSSRLSIPNPIISNFFAQKVQGTTAMTARTPTISNNMKPNIISKSPVQKKSNLSSNLPSKRPQTSSSPPLKTIKGVKNDKIKARPQTVQAHVKSLKLKNQPKSRIGNTDTDSNADEIEREKVEKEENRNREFSNFFKVIWDLSLKSRDQNLKHVSEVVDKSGLLELIVELRKTPKLIFIALLLRLYYTRWFYDNFYELFTQRNEEDENEEEAVKNCNFLSDFKIDQIHPPRFDVQSKSPKFNENLTQQNFSIKKNTSNQKNNIKSLSDLSEVDLDDSEILTHNNKNDKNDDKNSQNLIDHYLTNHKKDDGENEGQIKITNNEIYFNQDKTTTDFSIPPFKSTVSFDDTLKFVDKFFNHYIKSLDDENLKSNVKSSLHLFKTFCKSVKNKEIVLNDSITNLNHNISEYAYTKCSHEMEKFSENFRKMRKNGQIEEKLFEYDFSGIRLENRHLAEFSIKHEMPIIVQSIVSFKTVRKIGETLSNRNQKFCNVRTFLFALKTIQGIKDEEASAIELCVRVFVCSECFSIKKLLLCFVHFPEEEEIISRMFPDN